MSSVPIASTNVTPSALTNNNNNDNDNSNNNRKHEHLRAEEEGTKVESSTAVVPIVTIQVLFFGSAREAVGNVSSMTLEFPNGSDTTTLRTYLATQYPKLQTAGVLDDDNITLAINEEYVTKQQRLENGNVVALIPPISGG